ncbi:hypothetical protein PYJP_17140 [Pyrofollis japonicus]|uniref:hypothetical protein n=1 Tax=Pyrofollis japonicus TaxID=3060460 RepID=UPI00295C0E25|nr:hypothetical protein [Pyrofollis japonicus]BEP18362.1 hypothetical protein PYJP_17140 [Pyrofollis japonicus]
MGSPVNEEIKRLLEEKAKKMWRELREESGEVVEKVGPGSRHGIYVYDPSTRKWRLLRTEGEAFRPGELGDGTYVVYFDNTRCPACRIHDKYWYPFIEEHGDRQGYFYVIVLCAWFEKDCDSEAAAKTFEEYLVKASPTTLAALAENGRVIYREKYEGVLDTNELLREIVLGFPERVEKAKRGEPVEPPCPDKYVSPRVEELLRQLLQGRKKR